ncbi:hypothetical protein EIP86_009730 [Pleurotus ostreatoroseus]|nr:hypothetical protein EIP86_009730 [Pleurotus ostreatoroseus]
MSITLVSSKSVETIVEEVTVDEVVIEEKFEKGLPLPVQCDVAIGDGNGAPPA